MVSTRPNNCGRWPEDWLCTLCVDMTHSAMVSGQITISIRFLLERNAAVLPVVPELWSWDAPINTGVALRSTRVSSCPWGTTRVVQSLWRVLLIRKGFIAQLGGVIHDGSTKRHRAGSLSVKWWRLDQSQKPGRKPVQRVYAHLDLSVPTAGLAGV